MGGGSSYSILAVHLDRVSKSQTDPRGCTTLLSFSLQEDPSNPRLRNPLRCLFLRLLWSFSGDSSAGLS